MVLKRIAHAAHTDAAVSCLRAEDWVHSGHSMHGVRAQRCVLQAPLAPKQGVMIVGPPWLLSLAQTTSTLAWSSIMQVASSAGSSREMTEQRECSGIRPSLAREKGTYPRWLSCLSTWPYWVAPGSSLPGKSPQLPAFLCSCMSASTAYVKPLVTMRHPSR